MDVVSHDSGKLACNRRGLPHGVLLFVLHVVKLKKEQAWKMYTRILALDLGTKTGWAMSSYSIYSRAGENVWVNSNVLSGVEDFKGDRFSGGGMRFLRFHQWLDGFWDDKSTRPTRVVYEEVRRHLGTDAAHAYGGFMATLQKWCEYRSIPYEGIPVGTIKKHITGVGNASKGMVCEAVKRYGFKPQDDNEADALALLMFKIER